MSAAAGLPRAVALVLALAAAGCARSGRPRLPDAPAIARAAPAGGITRHVVLVSLDGLRPDAIEAFGAPTLARLRREGSHTLAATTILPSTTLPSHASMLTGEDVDEHGVTWNTNQVETRGRIAVPTIFDVARARGFETAAFFSKTKFEHLQREGALDYTQAPNTGRVPVFGDRWPMARTLGDVERYLEVHRPHLLFVHIAEPDYAGHLHGWMSRRYGNAVRETDAGLARVIVASDRAYGAGNWTLVVTADHGGHGRTHGSSDPRDVTIPWIAWGRGVATGTTLPAGIRTYDTASTVLWLLGLEEPGDWKGTPVTAAFVRAPAPLSSPARE